MRVSVTDAKGQLTDLVRRAEAGDEVILTARGKGMHSAALNSGDCFAYEVAREHGCSLHCVGEDFARTDVVAALLESLTRRKLWPLWNPWKIDNIRSSPFPMTAGILC